MSERQLDCTNLIDDDWVWVCASITNQTSVPIRLRSVSQQSPYTLTSTISTLSADELPMVNTNLLHQSRWYSTATGPQQRREVYLEAVAQGYFQELETHTELQISCERRTPVLNGNWTCSTVLSRCCERAAVSKTNIFYSTTTNYVDLQSDC